LSRVVPAQTPIEVHIPETTKVHASVEGTGASANPSVTTPLPSSAVSSYIQTTKPGITKLVTITATVGLGMAVATRWVAGEHLWTLGSFAFLALGVILGTALSASGANALNQWAERERDARMHRTANRPLPTGALTPPSVLVAGVLLSLAGLVLLWITCGLAAMTVSAACVLVYVLVYTPLKATTWTATFVGAIPGALPPLIGWSAAYREVGFQSLLDPGAISLFVLMFVWQLPHFFAIAWMYKDDYARGGFAILPVIDRTGARTSIVIAACTILLIPATIGPVVAMPQVLGVASLFAAALSGIAFAVLVGRLLRSRTRAHARAVFFASIIHLPILLVVMVLDAFVHTVL